MSARFESHNFYFNYANAVGTEDVELSQNLLTYELADLVKKAPNVVVKAIKESDIKIATPAKTSSIVEILVDNLSTNSGLKRRIAYLIGINTNLIEKQEGALLNFTDDYLNTIDDWFKAPGSGSSNGPVSPAEFAQKIGGGYGGVVKDLANTGKGAATSGYFGAITGLLTTGLNVWKSRTDKKTAETQMKAQIMDQINAKNGPKINTGAIIAICVLGAAVIGTSLFFIFKPKKAAA